MKNIQVNIINNIKVLETHNVINGELLAIQAQKGCNYELLNTLTNAAPQNIIAKRSGQDLLIILDENEGIGSPDEIQPDIIIKGYYGEAKGEDGDTDATGILIGLHENGKYYAYIPESGEVDDAISILADEMAEPQAIGGDELECGPFFFPWWGLLPLLPVFFIHDHEEIPAVPVEHNPVANNDTLTGIPTGKKAVFDVVANDSDPDKNLDPTTVKLIDPKTGDKVTEIVVDGEGTWKVDPENGKVTFTPNPDFVSDPTPVKYVVKDKTGLESNEATITPDYLPYHLDPVSVEDFGKAPENTPIKGNVLENDIDHICDVLKVKDFTVDTNGDGKLDTVFKPGTTAVIKNVGTITIAEDGNYTFTPKKGFNGDVPAIQYTLIDEQGKTDPTRVNLTITPDNKEPVLKTEDDTKTTKQNTPVSDNVLTNDPDKDTLIVKEFIVDGKKVPAGETTDIPDVGKLVINKDGSYTFTPDPEFTGDVPEVTYIATDGKFDEPATLNINVDGVPDANDDAFNVPKDEPSIIKPLPNDTHPDGDKLKIVEANVPPEQGTVEINDDGTLTFTPNPNFDGKPEITYVVEDENGDKDPAKVTLTLIDGKPPVAEDNNVTGEEDDPSITGNVITDKSPDGKVDSDPDGSIKGVTKFITPDGVEHPAGEKATIPNVGTIVINKDGSYEFIPEENYTGKVPAINYTIEDDKGLTDDADLNITVTPLPDAPIPDNNVITVREGGTQSLGLTAPIDVDSTDEQLTIIVKELPDQGIVKKADGTPVKAGDTLTVEELKGLMFTAPDDYVKGSHIGIFTYDVVDETGSHSLELGEVAIAISQIIVKPDTVVEGKPLTHSVELTIPTDKDEVYSFKLVDGDTNPATAGKDYSNLPKDITFTNGVTLNDDGTITIPKGVSKFEVSYPTIQDNAYEISETTKLIIGGEKATGTILDEDGEFPKSGDKPTIDVNNPTAKEGEELKFEITLSNPVDAETTMTLTPTFDVKNPKSAEIGDIKRPEYDKPKFTVKFTDESGNEHTITAKAGEPFTIPKNVTNLTASVIAYDDDTYEVMEKFRLQADVKLQDDSVITNDEDTGIGTILDENAKKPDGTPDPDKPLAGDKPTLEIEGDKKVEGEKLEFDITITNPLETHTTLKLTPTFVTKDGTGNPAEKEDITLPFEVSFVKDGQEHTITANDDGTFTVPAQVTKLKATTLTTEDKIFEKEESFVLKGEVILPNKGVITDTAEGIIVDKDGTKPDGTPDPQGGDRPTLKVGNAEAVEGKDLIFDVTLSNKVDAKTTLKLTPIYEAIEPNGNPAEAEDMVLPFIVTFVDENGKTQEIPVNKDGTFTIPENVTNLKAEALAKHDGIFEIKETFKLLGEVTLQDSVVIDNKGTGTILDPDGKTPEGEIIPQGGEQPTLEVGDAKANEGEPLEFKVRLSNKVDADTKLTLTPKFDATNPNGAEIDDIKGKDQPKPQFTVKYTDENGTHEIKEENGTFTIPKNVTDLTATVNTEVDDTYEIIEDFTLTGAVELPNKQTITDDGIAHITDKDQDKPALEISSPTQEEGKDLVFDITLTHPVDGMTELKLDPTFSNPNDPNNPNTAEQADVKLPFVLTYVDDKGVTQTIEPNENGVYDIPPLVDKLQATFETVPDNVYENNESFTLNGALELPNEKVVEGSGVGTITDDSNDVKYSDKPQISITADPSVTTEGKTDGLVYTVAIDNGKVSEEDCVVHIKPLPPEPTQAVTPEDIESITYTDVNGVEQKIVNTTENPTAIADFFKTGVDVKIVKGTTEAPAITIVAKDDALKEDAVEHLPLAIDYPKNPEQGTNDYTFGTQKATGDIIDNDILTVNLVATDHKAVDGLSLFVGNTSAVEGKPLEFDLKLSMPIKVESKLSLDKVFGTGNGMMDGADITGDIKVTYTDATGEHTLIFDPADNTYTVPANVTDLKVAIETLGTDAYEGLESMQLGAKIEIPVKDTTGQVVAKNIIADIGKGSIIDQDPTNPTPVAEPKIIAKVAEDNKLVFEVSQTLDSATDTTALVKLDLGTVEREDIKDIIYNDGTTETPIDIDTFINTGHTVTISAHTDVKPTFTIVAKQDTRYEKSETLTLTMSDVTGAEKGEDHAEGTIYDQNATRKVTKPGDPEEPDNPHTGDMPVVKIEATDKVAIEPKKKDVLEDDKIIFEISQSNISDFDTTVKAVLNVAPRDAEHKASIEDVRRIDFNDGLGNPDSIRTLTDAEIKALIDPEQGMTITIPKDSDPTQVKPSFTFWPAYDEDFEKYDELSMSLSEPVDARVSEQYKLAIGMIEDKSKTPGDRLWDKPVLNIEATDPEAIEGAFDNNNNADVLKFAISQTKRSSFDTTANITLDLGTGDKAVELDDISMVIFSKDGSNDPEQIIYFKNDSEINRLLSGEYRITIPAGSDPKTFTPTFTIIPKDDFFKEVEEVLSMKLTLNEKDLEKVDPGKLEDQGTIFDDPNPGLDDTVFAKISVNKETVQEIDVPRLKYTIELVNVDGKPVPTLPNESLDIHLQWGGGISPVIDPQTGIVTSPDVNLSIVDGVSLRDQLPTTITIKGGKSTAEFIVEIKDDKANEVDETIIPTIAEIISANEVTDPNSEHFGKQVNDGGNNSFEIIERHSTLHGAKTNKVTAVTTIKDDDVIWVKEITKSVEPEGNALVHKVILNTTSTTTSTVNMNISGPTATIAGDESSKQGHKSDIVTNKDGKAIVEVSTDGGQHWTTIEVAEDGSFDVDIPGKIIDFLVKVPTKFDWTPEGPSEFYTIGGQIGDREVVSNKGIIKDFEWSRISEEGLLEANGAEVDGLEDNDGEFNIGASAIDGEKADTTDLAHASSKLLFTRKVDHISYIGDKITSDGNVVEWNWVDTADTRALVGSIKDAHDLDTNNQPKEKEVIRLQLDANDTDFTDGIDYEIILSKGVDHLHIPDQKVYQRDDNGEFILDAQGNKIEKENNSIEDTLDLKFEAFDSIGERGDFAVVVEDDSPNVKTESGSQLIPSKLLVNVMVCLDLSASMDYDLSDTQYWIHPNKLADGNTPLKDENGRWCTDNGRADGTPLNGIIRTDENGNRWGEPLYDENGHNVKELIFEPPRDVYGNIKTDANGNPEPNMWKWNWIKNPDHDGVTRLDVAKAAFIKLLHTYESYGEVRVKIVGFATKADVADATRDRWVDVNEAINIINSMKAQFMNGKFIGSGVINSGFNNWPASAATNYDAALAVMKENFDKTDAGYLDKEHIYRPDGTIETTFMGTNEMYFLTDGKPSRGDGNDQVLENKDGGWNENGIQPAEQVLWETFLKENAIKSHSVSFTEVPLTEQIEAIAFNGVKPDNAEDAIHALHAKSAEALDHILQNSITVTPVSSNVVNSIYATGTETTYGGDNASITSISLAGRHFRYDAKKDITIDLDTSEVIQGSVIKVVTPEKGSHFEVDLKTGACVFLGSAAVATAGGSEELKITYVLTDKDGDYDSATRTFIFRSEKTIIETPTLEIEVNRNPNSVTEDSERYLEYKARFTHGGISSSNAIFNVKPMEWVDPDTTISEHDGNITADDIEYIRYTDISTAKQVILNRPEQIQSFFDKGINVGIHYGKSAADTIYIKVKDDIVKERDEVLELHITKPKDLPNVFLNYDISKANDTATGRVIDNDLSPTIESLFKTVTEKTGATVSGAAEVLQPQSVETLTVNGEVIYDAANPTQLPKTFTGKYGTLVISGYDAVNGHINYKYTENGQAQTHNIVNDDIYDEFVLSGTDKLGLKIYDDAANLGISRLIVSILDTVPSAMDDSAEVQEDKVLTASGNVLLNDTPSADAMTNNTLADKPLMVTGAVEDTINTSHVPDAKPEVLANGLVLKGTYGTLTIYADGRYTYVLDNDNPVVQALDENQVEKERFTYTITDADGDKATKHLLITVNGTKDIVVSQANDDSWYNAEYGVNSKGERTFAIDVITNELVADRGTALKQVTPNMGQDTDQDTPLEELVVEIVGAKKVFGSVYVLTIENEGQWVVGADGLPNHVVQFIPNKDFHGDPTPIQYVLHDGPTVNGQHTGHTSEPATITLKMKPEIDITQPAEINNSPVVHVSEEGLKTRNGEIKGIADKEGNDDTTDSASNTAALEIDNANQVQFLGIDQQPTHIGGTAVKWTLEPNEGKMLTAFIDKNDDGKQNANETKVLRAELLGNDTVKATLLTEIKHPTNSVEDTVSIDLAIKAANGGEKVATGTMTVVIEDDSIQNGVVVENDVGHPFAVNLVFALDISDSMRYVPGTTDLLPTGHEKSRWDVARDAIRQLVHQYTDDGHTVNIIMATFNDHVGPNSGWIQGATEADIESFFGGITLSGGTSYTAAVDNVITAYNQGAPHGDRTTVYTISDGAPDTGESLNDPKNATTAQNWLEFLNDNNITDAHSYGFANAETSKPATVAELETLAYDAEKPHGADSGSAEIVNTEGDLIKAMMDTVIEPVAGGYAFNKLDPVTGKEYNALGADGLDKILSVKYEFQNNITTVTDDNHNNHIIVDTFFGKLAINTETGEYTYQTTNAKVKQYDRHIEKFTLEARDGDGDISTTDLEIRFTYDPVSGEVRTFSTAGNVINTFSTRSMDVDDTADDSYVITDDSFVDINDTAGFDLLITRNTSGTLNLDFTNNALQSKVSGINMLDLTQDGSDTSVKQVVVLDYDAVEAISENNELFIKADLEDLVKIDNAVKLDDTKAKVVDEVSYTAYDLNHDLVADLYINGGEVIL